MPSDKDTDSPTAQDEALHKALQRSREREVELQRRLALMERSAALSTDDSPLNREYLKNVLVKYLETNDFERFVPVFARILQLEPAEVDKVRRKRQARASWLGAAHSWFGGS
ncbi:MAG: hypothetical protein MHM6MM_007782 [Cercozoa sp. M6MM]